MPDTHRIKTPLSEAMQAECRKERARIDAEVLPRLGLKARTVLIVGGAGYIGTVLSRHLLNLRYRVRCLDLTIYGHEAVVYPFLSNATYEFVHGDLCDPATLRAALRGVSDVVLLAGLVGDPITRKYPEAAARINDAGHATILRALSKQNLNKVIFVSTCSNYGLMEADALADETTALNPLSSYAKSKVAFEKEFLGLGGKADFHVTVLRFATAFGLSPRMRFDLTVNEFTREVFLGNDLLVYDPATWRPYCHVQDFAEVIHRVLEAAPERVRQEIFNAGGDVNNFTKQMIVDAILEQLPPSKIAYQQHGSDPRNYQVNFAKIRERLAFEPAYSVHDGITEIAQAMRGGLFRTCAPLSSFYGNYRLSASMDSLCSAS